MTTHEITNYDDEPVRQPTIEDYTAAVREAVERADRAGIRINVTHKRDGTLRITRSVRQREV